MMKLPDGFMGVSDPHNAGELEALGRGEFRIKNISMGIIFLFSSLVILVGETMLKPWLLLLKLEGERNECRKMDTIFRY